MKQPGDCWLALKAELAITVAPRGPSCEKISRSHSDKPNTRNERAEIDHSRPPPERDATQRTVLCFTDPRPQLKRKSDDERYGCQDADLFGKSCVGRLLLPSAPDDAHCSKGT
jgi:hypothetical protein